VGSSRVKATHTFDLWGLHLLGSCSPLSRSWRARSSSLSARFGFLAPARPKTEIKIGIAMMAMTMSPIAAAIAILN
jgi:hypothetical protein